MKISVKNLIQEELDKLNENLDNTIYYIESSAIGTVPEPDDQFKPAIFNTVNDAKKHINDIIKYPNIFKIESNIGDWFLVFRRIDDEDKEYVSNKIFVK